MRVYLLTAISTALALLPAGILAGGAGQSSAAAASARQGQGSVTDECHIFVHEKDDPVTLFAYGKNVIGQNAFVQPVKFNNNPKDQRIVPIRQLRLNSPLNDLEWEFSTRADDKNPTECIAKILPNQNGWVEGKYVFWTRRTTKDKIPIWYEKRLDAPGFLYE